MPPHPLRSFSPIHPCLGTSPSPPSPGSVAATRPHCLPASPLIEPGGDEDRGGRSERTSHASPCGEAGSSCGNLSHMESNGGRAAWDDGAMDAPSGELHVFFKGPVQVGSAERGVLPPASAHRGATPTTGIQQQRLSQRSVTGTGAPARTEADEQLLREVQRRQRLRRLAAACAGRDMCKDEERPAGEEERLRAPPAETLGTKSGGEDDGMVVSEVAEPVDDVVSQVRQNWAGDTPSIHSIHFLTLFSACGWPLVFFGATTFVFSPLSISTRSLPSHPNCSPPHPPPRTRAPSLLHHLWRHPPASCRPLPFFTTSSSRLRRSCFRW